MPTMKKTRLRIFRIILFGIAALASAAAVLLILLLWDAYRAGQMWDHNSLQKAFDRRGSFYYTVHPAMIRQSFSAEKGRGEYRVFVLGSSQAMGTPYVDPKSNFLSHAVFDIPNEGGISTWLAQYLKWLLPARSVMVINAAKAGGDLRDSVATLKEIFLIGHPDAIVILEGNNERSSSGVQDFRLREGADFQATLDELSQNFKDQLAIAARLAQQYKVPTYVLSVPNNLRDWLPTASKNEIMRIESDDILRSMGRHRKGEVMQRLRSYSMRERTNPVFCMAMARALDRARDFRGARRFYLQAKDYDRAFLRARSRWNDAVRAVHGEFIKSIDMERILFSYARDGIPGFDLFHDYCHMTLAANRTIAFEIAKQMQLDLRLQSKPLPFEAANMELFTARQLRRLYWIKALKWTRSMWLGASDESGKLNAQTAALKYKAASANIDERIELLRHPESLEVK